MKNLWKQFKHWCCKVGLCNLNKCSCTCHDKPKGRSKAYYPTAKAKKVLPPPLPEENLKKVMEARKTDNVKKNNDPCSMF